MNAMVIFMLNVRNVLCTYYFSCFSDLLRVIDETKEINRLQQERGLGTAKHRKQVSFHYLVHVPILCPEQNTPFLAQLFMQSVHGEQVTHHRSLCNVTAPPPPPNKKPGWIKIGG